MRRTLLRMAVGAALFTLIAGSFSHSALASQAGERSEGGWTSFAPAPVFNSEAMAKRAREMDRYLLEQTGRRLPGEDSLGGGTSITH